MQVKTRDGYKGQVIGQSLDGKDYHVTLEGCTYDIDHHFDVIPKADCEEIVQPKRYEVISNYCTTEKQATAVSEAIKAVLAWMHDPEAEKIRALSDGMTLEMYKKLNAARYAVQEGNSV